MTATVATKIGFQNVLVPVDFTDVSLHAVEYAKSIARRYESSIVLAHVTSDLSPSTPPEVVWFESLSVQQPAEHQLIEWGAELRSQGFQSKAVPLVGAIQEEVLKLAEKESSDLIVAGTHGRAGIQRLLFGSDAEGLYRHAKCPILVVGPHAQPVDGTTWHPQTIVLSCDLEPSSAPTAAYASHLAQELGAALTIFHVDDSQGRVSKASKMQEFEEALEPLLPEGQKPVYIWRTLMIGFGVGATIANLARERHADLILMGARHSSQATSHLPNGIAPQTIAKAPCPVMILHHA